MKKPKKWEEEGPEIEPLPSSCLFKPDLDLIILTHWMLTL
jgi:hypothetical protein